MKATDLFKKNKPVLRKVQFVTDGNAGDLPYLWDQYKKGLFKDVPDDFSMADFVEYVDVLNDSLREMWILEDYVEEQLTPVALVLCMGNGWTLEPYVFYFKNASPRIVLRTYVGFMKKTKYRKDIGACLVRVDNVARNLANRVERLGLLEYVGKIWGGAPNGNQYLYSVRCGKKVA